MKYYESDLIEDIYNILYDRTSFGSWFPLEFPDAVVSREFAQIVLNGKYVIKVERI